jgi:hypothetical protein
VRSTWEASAKALSADFDCTSSAIIQFDWIYAGGKGRLERAHVRGGFRSRLHCERRNNELQLEL